MHNGSHTISATVQYSWITYVNGQPSGGTTSVTASITVDVENLLITSTTPTNPAPIQWDPGTASSVTLGATLSACYKANQPVTLKIFTSSQVLVKTITLGPTPTIGPGSTTVSAIWDGSSDTPAMYPDGQNPPMAKGIYLFQWNAGIQSSGGDCDQDKSGTLAVTQTDSYFTAYDQTSDLNTTDDSDVLTDNNVVTASAAQVTVYYPDLSVAAGPKTMPTTVNAPGASNPVDDEIQFPLSVSQDGFYTHLFAAQDNDLTTDKGHRQRWALQMNKHPASPRADDFDEIANIAPYSDTDAAHKQKLVVVGDLPNGTARFGAYAAFPKGIQSWSTVLQALTEDTIVQIYGHAEAGGFDCAATDINSDGSAMLYAQNPQQANHLISGNIFHHLSIVVFEGCLSANTDATYGNLLQASITAGAGCAIGFTAEMGIYYVGTDTEEDLGCGRVWAEAFWRAVTSGEPDRGRIGTPDTVATALLYAPDQVRADPRSNNSYHGFDTNSAQGNTSLTGANGLS